MIDCGAGKLPASIEPERLKQLSIIVGSGYLRCLCWQSYYRRQLEQKGKMQGAEMDRQTPDLELVRLCLALETDCRCQERRASCCCLVTGEGLTGLLLNSTELHLKLNWCGSKQTCMPGKWLLLSESNFLKADPRHGTKSRLGEYLCFLIPLRNWA